MNPADVDAVLAQVTCALMKVSITVSWQADDTGGSLILRGHAPLPDDPYAPMHPFFYVRPGYVPTSGEDLLCTVAEVCAEFAAHEVLEHLRYAGALIHDSHKDGVLWVRTGPQQLGVASTAKLP